MKINLIFYNLLLIFFGKEISELYMFESNIDKLFKERNV